MIPNQSWGDEPLYFNGGYVTQKVATKYLPIMPKRFTPITLSIESLFDISTMLIEETIVSGSGKGEYKSRPRGLRKKKNSGKDDRDANNPSI
jgi:hypothetical protein